MDFNNVLRMILSGFLILITFSYDCAYTSVPGYVHPSAGACGGQRQCLSHPTWALGT